MRADTFNRRCVDRKLAIGVTVAGMKSLAIARTALHQLSILTLRTGNRSLVGLIDGFCIITFRIVTTTNKHPKSPLTQNFICATLGACVPFQHFDNMTIGLIFQGTNIITSWIIHTAKKRAMFTTAYHQICPASGAGIVFPHRE